MNKGMTLIETVVSIAIISVAVVFAISAFPLGMRITDMNQRSSVALFLASTKIEEVIYEGYSEAEEGVFTEDFGEIEQFEGYKRETEIECFAPEGECIPGMKRVDVTVYPQSLAGSSVGLTTLINE